LGKIKILHPRNIRFSTAIDVKVVLPSCEIFCTKNSIV